MEDYQSLESSIVARPTRIWLNRRTTPSSWSAPAGYLATATILAQRGIKVVVLDDDNKLSPGSRAICFAKRTLEIFDRLGVGQPMVDKGIPNVGKVFFQDDPVYRFNLLPEAGTSSAFINLQQYYVEGYLHERAETPENLSLRWKNKVAWPTQHADHVEVDGGDAGWIVLADRRLSGRL